MRSHIKIFKRNSLAALVLILLSSAALFTGVGTSAQSSEANNQRKTELFDGSEVVAGQVLVKFRGAASREGVAEAKRSADVAAEKKVGRTGALLLHSRSKNTATLVRELAARGDVLYAEPNYVIRTTASAPDDPQFAEQWALQNTGSTVSTGAGTPGADIGAVPAWEVSTGSRDNVVAVVDTGIDYNHPDLAANVWSAPAAFTVNIGGQTIRCEAGTHGFNSLTNTCDPLDDFNHGTHVAGIVGAVGGNGVGVSGVSQTASIMGLKFIDASGRGTIAGAINAIEFAIQAKQAFGAGANVRVLSNSWGWTGTASQALLDEINLAEASDMLFVAGAGNSGGDDDLAPFYPASYAAPNVISVAATDNNDALAVAPNWASNYGANSVHLGAPGLLVLSTVIGGSYDWFSGTSMATPHVSGAAALVLSRCSLDTAALKGTLLDHADPVTSLNGVTVTGARLNVNKAIRACAVVAPPPPPPNAAPSVTLSSPVAGATFTAPANININADASDGDGSVTRVDFYAGSQLIGTATASPFGFAWGGVPAGTYSLTAVATDDAGAQTTSAAVNVSVNQPPARPAAPTSLTADSIRQGEVTLRWRDNSTNEQSFRIERSTSASGGFVTIATVGVNGTSYTDRGVQRRQTYYYRVLAANGGGSSAYSNTASTRVK